MNAPVRWTTTNMTSKGQVLIPKDVRDVLGLVPGAPVQVGVQEGNDAAIVRPGRGSHETPEQRRVRFLSALETVRARHRGERPTDEIMRDLRGDEPLP